MSEEILKRGLNNKPEKIGKWDFYNIGSTSIKSLKEYGIIHDFDYGTNTYVQNHNGNYPLYLSQTTNNGIIGYIDSYDYDTKCIT